MNHYAFYFLPFVLLPIIIHLIGKKPEKETKFPPFEILQKIYREYKWYLRVRNLLLLFLRMSIIFLFIISVSKISCGLLPEKNEGLGIVIDSSYSTMTFDGNKRIFKKEIEIAKEILMKAKDARVFKCSDTLTGVYIDEILNEKLEPDFKNGNAKRCYEELSRMGFSEILWITDGRKEGYEELKGGKIKMIDVSQGKKFPNAWIDRVEIKGGTLEFHLKSNGKVDVTWGVKSGISSSSGKIELNEEEIVRTTFNENSEWTMIKITGDALDADNYYFVAKKGGEKKLVGIFNFSPSEVPYLDESFYIKKTLSTEENIRIKEKVPFTMKGLELEKERYSFLFLLNPAWNQYVKDLINSAFNQKIPIFVSAGEGDGFKKVCEFMGIKVRGIKEIEARRKLRPASEPLWFSEHYGEDIFDEIFVKKIYLTESSREIEPIIILSSGEPLLLKIPDKNFYILTTTADPDWSQFPIARIFVPLMLEIVLRSSKNEEVIEIRGGFDIRKGEKTVVKPHIEASEVPGIYQKGGKTIVANLYPTEESLLTPLSFVESETESPKNYSGIHLWKYALFFTGILLVLESILLR